MSLSVGTMGILGLCERQETASETTKSQDRKEDAQNTNIQGFCIQSN